MMEGWSKYRFAEIVSYTKKPRGLIVPKSIPFIPMDLIPLERFTLDNCNYIQELSSGTYVENGDLLLAKITPSFENGKQAILNFSHPFGFATTEVIPMKGKDNIVLTEYVSFFLKQEQLRTQLAGKMEGSTGRQRLSTTALNDTLVNLPPLPEQRKIVYVLNAIQKAIEHQDKLVRQSTELKKALMQKLFTEGTTGEKQKQTEIGLVPQNWEVKQLIETVEFIDYGVSEAIPKTPPRNGVKIVSTADINRAGDLLYNQIRRIEVPDRTIAKLTLVDGDLLFNWRNSPELIGKSTIYHDQDEPHIFASFILRINCGEKKSHNYFLKYLMNHYREEGVFIKLARRAVNQANYNRNEISVLKIPVPPISEQVEIARIITQVENKVNYHKKKKETLNDLFRTLLHDLMTGQRRVNEIDFPGMAKEYSLEEEPLSMAAEP